MALSKRDQKTLTIMMVAVLGFVVWEFGIDPVYTSYQELTETLESEQAKYEQNRQTLAEAKSIDEDYARVEAQFPKEDPERDPSEVFNEEVVNLAEAQVGKVSYSPPTTAEIKGATGYEFLILPLTAKSTIAKTAKLLAEFDSKGYLIQTAKIDRESDLSKDDLTVELNLGRIVKIAEEPAEPGIGAPGGLKLQKGTRK